MQRLVFPSFSVDAPEGWRDITATLEDGQAPFTLARDDGVGALQFSIALYGGGKVPEPSVEALLEMVREFGQSHALGEATGVVTESGPLRLAAGTFDDQGYFLRAWYLSDGRNFAFATYNCESGEEQKELPECEQMVRSIGFPPFDDGMTKLR